MNPLIITGFHRSGTSTLARLLSGAGLDLGTELIGANASNPYGHFEDREIVNFHTALLRDQGMSWHVTDDILPFVSARRWDELEHIAESRQTNSQIWGFKDPRACLFLNLWKHVLPDLRVCALYRNPAEAARSLHWRHAIDVHERRGPTELHHKFWNEPDHALRMWLVHNRALVRFGRLWPQDTHFLGFHDLQRGRDVVQELRTRWALHLKPVPPRTLIDPSLASDTTKRPISVSTQVLVDRAMALWDELEDLSRQASQAAH